MSSLGPLSHDTYQHGSLYISAAWFEILLFVLVSAVEFWYRNWQYCPSLINVLAILGIVSVISGHIHSIDIG